MIVQLIYYNKGESYGEKALQRRCGEDVFLVELLAAGKTLEEIKEMNKNENIFGAPTAARANQIFVTVSGRIKIKLQTFLL